MVKAHREATNGWGPYDFNLYTLSPEEQKKIKGLPKSLDEALDALEGQVVSGLIQCVLGALRLAAQRWGMEKYFPEIQKQKQKQKAGDRQSACSRPNRSAVIRIPAYAKSPETKRFELRNPDATANPYYAYAAILMAGLDGIENKIDR